MNSNEDSQKQINISITKIFNWPQSESVCSFDLIFYPEDSDLPIIEKSVAGVFLSNSMNLNSLLKITYTQDQNIIILKMLKNRKDRRQVLGEFQIDLDVLRQKNVQYFPFGKDHVLQINLYVPMRANSRTSRTQDFPYGITRGSRLYTNQNPLSLKPTPEKSQGYERRRVPQRYGSNERLSHYENIYDSNPYREYDPKMKKSFSQKVLTLLQEVKSIKQDIIKTGPRVSRQLKATPRAYEQNSDQYLTNQRGIKKSMSDSKFITYGTTYGTVTSQASPSFRRQQQSAKSTKPQKHRLILSTLNVVPCQYYYQNEPQKVQRSQNQMPPAKQNCRTVSNAQRGTDSNKNYQDYYQSRLN